MKKIIGMALIFVAGCVAPYKVGSYFQSDRLVEADGKTVAVLPFQGGAGPDITDLTNLEFGRLNRYRLIERVRVDDLYAEQDFDPERVDDETAARIGKMLGARAVVLGRVYEFTPGRVSISMRLVDSETGEHFWQAKDTLEGRDMAVRELAKDRFDAQRLMRDPEALAAVAVRAMVETVNR